MWIHRIAGTVISLITLYNGIRAWMTVKKIMKNPHSIFVFLILFLILFVALGGIFTRSKLCKNVWKTSQSLTIKKIHKVFAYSIIFGSFGAIYTGIQSYRTNPKHPDKTAWEFYYLILVAILFLVPEFLHRYRMLNEPPFNIDY